MPQLEYNTEEKFFSQMLNLQAACISVLLVKLFVGRMVVDGKCAVDLHVSPLCVPVHFTTAGARWVRARYLSDISRYDYHVYLRRRWLRRQMTSLKSHSDVVLRTSVSQLRYAWTSTGWPKKVSYYQNDQKIVLNRVSEIRFIHQIKV